jgi:hypothetical protein
MRTDATDKERLDFLEKLSKDNICRGNGKGGLTIITTSGGVSIHYGDTHSPVEDTLRQAIDWIMPERPERPKSIGGRGWSEDDNYLTDLLGDGV